MKDITENEETCGSYWKNADGTLEAKMVRLGPVGKAKTSTTSPAASLQDFAFAKAVTQVGAIDPFDFAQGKLSIASGGSGGPPLPTSANFNLQRLLLRQPEDQRQTVCIRVAGILRPAVEAKKMGEPWQELVAQASTTTLCRVRASRETTAQRLRARRL